MHRLMRWRASLVLLALIQLVASPGCVALAAAPQSHEQRVREFVAAFNSREIEKLLTMVSDDIQWLTLAGDKIVVETQGKAQLRESLSAYFESTPSARSELQWVQQTTARVAAMERATWQGSAGPKSQASLCVYEFRDGLIARVYYYPVER
jgi:hypothetical protein